MKELTNKVNKYKKYDPLIFKYEKLMKETDQIEIIPKKTIEDL